MATDNTKANVTVGRPKTTGAVYRAPAGTAVPTDATTALANTFVAMGYISEDGLTNGQSRDNDTIREWGGESVYEVEENFEDTFQLKMIEALNVDVLKAVYNADNVSGTLAAGISVEVNSDEHESAAWVIEMIMRNKVLKRICIPDGKVTDIADIVYRRNEVVGYDLTIKAFPDSNGNTHYEYIKQPAT